MNTNIILLCFFIKFSRGAQNCKCEPEGKNRRARRCGQKPSTELHNGDMQAADSAAAEISDAAACGDSKNFNDNKEQNMPVVEAIGDKNCDQERCSGLLHYRRWWELIEVEILTGGKLISGVPIFVEENTLRVINNDYSYFIELDKVDYIRTKDGLVSSFDLPDDKT